MPYSGTVVDDMCRHLFCACDTPIVPSLGSDKRLRYKEGSGRAFLSLIAVRVFSLSSVTKDLLSFGSLVVGAAPILVCALVVAGWTPLWTVPVRGPQDLPFFGLVAKWALAFVLTVGTLSIAWLAKRHRWPAVLHVTLCVVALWTIHTAAQPFRQVTWLQDARIPVDASGDLYVVHQTTRHTDRYAAYLQARSTGAVYGIRCDKDCEACGSLFEQLKALDSVTRGRYVPAMGLTASVQLDGTYRARVFEPQSRKTLVYFDVASAASRGGRQQSQ